MLKEFKDFAFKGNVLDLAVATVLGAAFNAIVGAVVDNIIMPIVGILTGGINFDSAVMKIAGVDFKYGLAISAVIKFIVIALFLFAVVKAANKAKAPEAAAPAGPSEIDLLTEIRDALKK